MHTCTYYWRVYCYCDVQLGVMAVCVYHMVYLQYANVYVNTHICTYTHTHIILACVLLLRCALECNDTVCIWGGYDE